MLGKKGKFVGLDIGRTSIKIAELQESRNPEFQLHRRDIDGDDESMRQVKLSRLLQEMIGEYSLGTKKVVVSFQSEQTIFKYLELPKLNPRELAMALPIEAQKYFPWPLDDTILTYVQVPPLTGEKERIGVTFSAFPKKPFQEVVDSIKHCSIPSAGSDLAKVFSDSIKRYKLSPAVMEIPAMALSRANIYNYGSLQDQTLGLVNLGEQFTNIVILRGEYIYFSRDLPIGGRDFTKALQVGLRLTLRQAEEEKRKIDLSRAPDFNILPAVEKWVREIKYSFDFYQYRLTGSALAIDGIVLSGGGALMTGLPTYMEGALNLPVERDKTHRIALRHVSGKPAVEDDMLHFKTAVGLAIRGLEK